MNLGKALSFASPMAGMVTGQGIGKAMPYLSPAYGMLARKGPFGEMDEDDDDPIRKLLSGFGGEMMGGGRPTGMFGSGMPMMGMFPGMFGGG